jgi:hypothetical protein
MPKKETKILKLMFNLGKKEKPWQQEDIDEFFESVKQEVQKATDEAMGRAVEDMDVSDILSDGRVINIDGYEIELLYRGEKFTVTIDHPEL